MCDYFDKNKAKQQCESDTKRVLDKQLSVFKHRRVRLEHRRHRFTNKRVVHFDLKHFEFFKKSAFVAACDEGVKEQFEEPREELLRSE